MQQEIEKEMKEIKGFDFAEAFGSRSAEELGLVLAMLKGMTAEQKRAMNERIKDISRERRMYMRGRWN